MGIIITQLPDGRIEITDEEGDRVHLPKGSQIETSNVTTSKLLGKVNNLEDRVKELNNEVKDLKYRVANLEQ